MLLQQLKALLFLGFFYFINALAFCQNQKIADSLSRIYQQGNLSDTAKLELLRNLSFNEVRDLKLSSKYAEELISLSIALGNNTYLARGYFQRGNKQRLLGNFNGALDAYFKSADVASKAKSIEDEGSTYGAIADVYSLSHNHPAAMTYYNKAIEILRPSGDPVRLASAILNAGDEYRINKIYDSALLYFREAHAIFEKANYLTGIAYSVGDMGMVYAGMGKNDLAENNINIAVPMLEELGDYYPICEYFLSMCDIYLEKQDKATALEYALRSVKIAGEHHLKEQIRDASLKVSEIYESLDDPGKALSYYKNFIVYRDSIDNVKALQERADLRRNFEVSQTRAEVNLLNRQKKLQRVLLLVALIVLAVIMVLVIILLRNNRQKQRAYTLLTKAKVITEEQRDQTNIALDKLKRTQAHLIQSAKMASLGELTAGIAHEIQNPLNFVNNFSEVNIELITELQEENTKGNPDAVDAISKEIFTNEERISQHGKRADAIVKGMLQHSMSGASEKILTDINALVDEYLRLAYHGLRAKDKSFNTALHTDFDLQAGEINVVPQEIGRVILNLLNNAFYAVTAKKKEAGDDFSPVVSVSTKKINNQLLISVKDNGTGISAAVKEKIFQPFFTTKGPGLGTGLGLSLSYDIVRAHSGEIRVETEEGEGCEFVVILPADKGEA